MDLPTPWAIPSALACALLVGLNAYVWRRADRGPLWPAVPLLLAGALLFAAGDLATFFAQDPTARWTTNLVLYAGVIIVGPAVFVLAARHAELWGGSALSPALVRLAAGSALAFGLVVLSNPWHGLFLTVDPAGNQYGPLWYLYALAQYGWMLGAIVIAARVGTRPLNRPARREGRLIALAAALALSGNAVYLASPWPLPFDPTSLGLCASCVIFIQAIRLGVPGLGKLSSTDLMRAATDGVLVLDMQGRLVARSPTVDQWLPEEPRQGEPVMPALARAFVQRERADLPLTAGGLAADLLSGDQPAEGHLFRLCGQDRWVRLVSLQVSDEQGRSVQLLRLRDETQLQRLMAAVEDQASMLEAVILATDEGVLVHVGDEIRFASPQFHEIWETPEELLDAREPRRLLEAYLPRIADREGFLSAVDRVREDPLARIRDEYPMNDGRTLERISLPLVQGGRAIGRVWRVRDVTKQRQSEQTLLQAQKLESLGLLSGGIAHDFNNLLVSVMGSAGLARAEVPHGSPAQEYLEDIERASERASELTRQLLAYAGKGRVESEPVHLSEVVREVVALLEVSLPKRVRLHCKLAEQLPAVRGDASQLRQVTMNLMLNAADAIGEGEGVVDVTTEVHELTEADTGDFARSGGFEPGRYVVLAVTDSGSGMAPDVRQRIFDPFFTTKFTGRGLGLAASLGIVHGHHGHIGVESEPGRGSAFRVLLPAVGAPTAVREATREVPEAGRLDATVLVVDDEARVARVAARMVEAAGGKAIVVASGQEALDLHRKDGAGIDAWLLDLTMPGLSGRDTLMALREFDATVPVILTSGYPEEEVSGPIGSDPALSFIQKPYRTEKLVEALRAALEPR